MFVIVGLGNPGREYAKTRHNVGFMTIDKIAERLNISVNKKGFRSVYGEGRLGGTRVVLAKPETFMNNSGWAVGDLLKWYKPQHDEVIVIYDDIDLPCGALRIRMNGSAGTHNGMRSIESLIGFEDFPRIRVGIGKPAHGLIDHVLGVPTDEEAKLIDGAMMQAAEAAELIIAGKPEEAQTRFNYKPPKKQKAERGMQSAKFRYVPQREISAFSKCEEVFFENTDMDPNAVNAPDYPFGIEQIKDAEVRLVRFAPLIEKAFPETAPRHGIIESELKAVQNFQKQLLKRGGCSEAVPAGSLFIKADSELPIAGSVKARGGIYEVLKHTEKLALEHGLITTDSDYSTLLEKREFFSKYKIQVGSTGNLGLSIGIASAALGYDVTVHMSADAKQWKKDLLREKGVDVIEYQTDYSEAVRQGRKLSDADPMSYFIDDENSVDLFMGYAVAALRLRTQLSAHGVSVDAEHPLFVYLPCGVGGAPGGITFGLKKLFGDAVRCFFVEPVNAPCMLAAFAKGECVPVAEFGLSGKTQADGLAVGCASKLVFEAMRKTLDGEFTVSDGRLLPLLRLLNGSEGIFVEPSAAISAAAYMGMMGESCAEHLKKHGLDEKMSRAAHILWATGGGLVPETERNELCGTGAKR